MTRDMNYISVPFLCIQDILVYRENEQGSQQKKGKMMGKRNEVQSKFSN